MLSLLPLHLPRPLESLRAVHGLSWITILVAIFVTSFIHVPRNWNYVQSHITRFALVYNGCYDCIDPFLPVPRVYESPKHTSLTHVAQWPHVKRTAAAWT
jgi:hypothetical protein